jgi:hypothetical protein
MHCKKQKKKYVLKIWINIKYIIKLKNILYLLFYHPVIVKRWNTAHSNSLNGIS